MSHNLCDVGSAVRTMYGFKPLAGRADKLNSVRTTDPTAISLLAMCILVFSFNFLPADDEPTAKVEEKPAATVEKPTKPGKEGGSYYAVSGCKAR